MAERPQPTEHVTEAPILVAPKEEALVDGEALTFQWKPLDGAEAYALEVAADANFDEVVFEKGPMGTEETSFTLPEPLPTDGDLYYWRVRARHGEEWSPGDRVESFISVTAERAEAADEAPDRSEGYGPAAGLVGAAGVEAAAEATGSKPLVDREQEIEHEMGVAREGVEAGQIIGLISVVAVAILVITVVVIYWVTTVSQGERRQVVGMTGYPELQATETEAAQQLQQYELLSEQDGTYRIPIDEAMRLVATEEYTAGAGRQYSPEVPLQPPAPEEDTSSAETPEAQLPEGPANTSSAAPQSP